MTHIDVIGNFCDAKYPSYLAYFVSSDCDYEHDPYARLIKNTYNIDYYIKQRMYNVNANSHDYFNRIKRGLSPWVELDKANNMRKIFTMIVKELYTDRIFIEDFRMCIKNLVELCKLHGVAYLAIPPLGINPVDGLEYDAVSHILDNEFKDTPIEITMYWPDLALKPKTPEEYYKPAVMTEDVYEIPVTGNDGSIEFNYGHVYKKIPERSWYPKGPYPEYHINPGDPYIDNKEPDAMIDMNREFIGRYFPDLNPEILQEDYLEIDKSKSDITFADKIYDPMKLHAIGLDSVSSHGYPLESILDPRTDFSKPPQFKYPAIPNIADPNDKTRIQPAARGINYGMYLNMDKHEVSLEPAYPEYHYGEVQLDQDNKYIHPTITHDNYATDGITYDKKFNTMMGETMNMNSDKIYNNDPLNRFPQACDNYNQQQSMLPPEQKMIEYNGAYYESDGQHGIISMPHFDHPSHSFDKPYLPPLNEYESNKL